MQNFLEKNDYEIRAIGAEDLVLNREWMKSSCFSRIENKSDRDINIKEIVLFKGKMPFDKKTKIYAEGYSMLSQYKGSLEDVELISCVTDKDHYRLPISPDFFTAYNLMLFMPEETALFSDFILIGFTSCKRFSNEIRFNGESYEIVIDFENIKIKAGESLDLEEFHFSYGSDKDELFFDFANRLCINHPVTLKEEIPTGWCSWYSYGPDLTQDDVFDNLKMIKETGLDLKYIQIDEGYAAYEGDWLDPGKTFPDGVDSLCRIIKGLGFEPAMWIGPFIAEGDSKLLKEHPEWFIKNNEGQPAPADQYTYGGWYHGPWYMLDFTHPGALNHIKNVFKTMHEEWGVNYFKMDGTIWGALPFGNRYNPSMTRVEAFRAAMKAIREGAGEDSFLLGCNAPMWPSLGTVDGMRIADDIHRDWSMMKKVFEENAWRSWQHGRLWISDPDCAVTQNLTRSTVDKDGNLQTYIEGAISDDEYRFSLATVFASGGMVLFGDSFIHIEKNGVNYLEKLIRARGTAAQYDNVDFNIARKLKGDNLYILAFNPSDYKKDFEIDLKGQYKIKDFWLDSDEIFIDNKIKIRDMAAHSANIYSCLPV